MLSWNGTSEISRLRAPDDVASVQELIFGGHGGVSELLSSEEICEMAF